jgi:hypothetical protein
MRKAKPAKELWFMAEFKAAKIEIRRPEPERTPKPKTRNTRGCRLTLSA